MGYKGGPSPKYQWKIGHKRNTRHGDLFDDVEIGLKKIFHATQVTLRTYLEGPLYTRA